MQSTRLNKLLAFLTTEPNDPFILYALATEYNSLNDTEQAYHYYLKLVDEHPAYVGTYYHLGKLYQKHGETDKAIAIYEQGMERAREKGDGHAFAELQGAYNTAAGLDYEDD
ncbi:tetratricopeptide repeat protein [Pedobacter sp. MC2016-15]|uniref:tetratricopeptide repeat protein n=1 Tax=Pedobacter sp. MC2016-15 TaxID=2994473 RepID=UPI0022462844|nr:tetratricopeptide repeat protein [Pedobacter sp. MC2016-15]MCX2477586.1 tetratricopeptide repeat protein [Pedobacter sp. MC2016-15]